jgi:phytoene dehydrogenase-like protein
VLPGPGNGPPFGVSPRAGLGAAATLAESTPRTLAERCGDPGAATVLRYACGLAGFLDGDVQLGLVGGFGVARLFSPTLVVGGTKNLANGLARVAARAGARAFVSSEVTRVEPDGERMRLTVSDGRQFTARTVVSTLDFRSTFLGLLSGGVALDGLSEAMDDWEVEPTGPFTAHFGIKGEPPVPAGGGRGDALMRVFGFSTPEEVDAYFRSVVRGELPARIAGHLTAVTAHDPLQASPGPYGPLNTLRVQAFVPFELSDGGGMGDEPATARHAGTPSLPISPGSTTRASCSSSAIRRSTSSDASGPPGVDRSGKARSCGRRHS